MTPNAMPRDPLPTPWPLLTAAEISASAKPIEDHRKPGVYFLLQGAEVVYVGKSRDVFARVATHFTEKRNRKDFDSWHWVPIALGELEALERAYIRAFWPKYNIDQITLTERGLPFRKNGRSVGSIGLPPLPGGGSRKRAGVRRNA